MNTPQLAFEFRWNSAADLASFESQGNEEAVAAIRRLASHQGQSLYLAGPTGSGRSHLLQAACGEMSRAGETAVYVPLAEYIHASPTLLEGLEHLSLVALDDIDRISGHSAWEEAVFHCYNRLHEAGAQLVVAACDAPDALDLQLPDLASRLAALLRFRLSAPDDERRQRILARAAAQRGLDLPLAASAFLLRHEARDLHHLMQVLDALDTASLRTGRRLTVPFIRAVLANQL